MSGRVFRIGRYVNGLKVVNQACVGWRNSKYSIGMNRKSFGLFTFTVFCSINVIDYICYRRNYEKEKKASITIEDICGTYVDSEKGYKLVIERITMPGDFEPLDNRIQYKIYQKDQSLFAEQDSTPYYDGNIGKGDYTLINNGDGTITLEYNTGEEICKFTKVQD